MAVELILSAGIANLDALPSQKMSAGQAEFTVKCMQAQCTTVDGAATLGSTYRFTRVRSNWLFLGQTLEAEDFQASGGLIDVGLYTINGGAVIDANCLMDGVDASGQITHTGFTAWETAPVYATLSHVKLAAAHAQAKTFWSLAGAASDPDLEYDIVATTTDAANDTAGADLLYTLLYGDMTV